jgi:hypothetical protein
MNFARAALVAAFALLPSAAFAQSAQDLVDGMAHCAAITAGNERLACYDSLSAQLRAAPPVDAGAPVAMSPPPGAAMPPGAAAPAPPSTIARSLGVAPQDQTRPDQFGSEALAPPAPPPGTPAAAAAAAAATPEALDSIKAGVNDYSFNPHDKFLVILDNGQIWAQLEADDGLAHFMKCGKNEVEISRGFLGSYNLVLNDGSTFKVHRLK